MGKDDEKGNHRGSSSSNKSQIDQLQLWEINDVILNQNYTRFTAEDGAVFYTLHTSRQDLPANFWDNERAVAMKKRERAERLVESSGREAQQVRGVTGGQLLSQRIVNNPNMGALTSSALSSQKKRRENKN
ncbi:hypothetical protein EsDP_00004781 [Epichloe bromicola]|uniref:Uncharacterized protein n=1 Tax=Epichloe bromicola TaxID=79588 RepID=A0ABQ0CSU0_9HYPO